MKNVRILIKTCGDLHWDIKQHCTKEQHSISKGLALRAFSIFVFLALVKIFTNLVSSHKSGPLATKVDHFWKTISECADFDLALWGPSLGQDMNFYQVWTVYLKNPSSESIFRFCLSGTCLFFGKAPLERKISKCADFDLALWGPSLGHNRTSYKVGSV